MEPDRMEQRKYTHILAYKPYAMPIPMLCKSFRNNSDALEPDRMEQRTYTHKWSQIAWNNVNIRINGARSNGTT